METGPRRIVFLAFEDAVLLDISGPMEAFSVAGALGPFYECIVASMQGGLVRCKSGLQIATVPIATLHGRAIDTILVPGGGTAGPQGTPADAVEWLRANADRCRRVCSVCAGAFALAEAGLLEGRSVTTHWRSFDTFERLHPQADLQRGPIFLRDGKIWTAAGVTAGIDLALALIEDDLGHNAAMTIARMLVVFLKRPGGQAQFSGPLAAQSSADPAFSNLLAWIAQNLQADLSVEALAERVGMTPRTFARTFHGKVGQTPGKLIETLRVEAARRLLEQGGVAVKAVARTAGFGDEQKLRRAFQRQLGVGPAEYRARFGAGG